MAEQRLNPFTAVFEPLAEEWFPAIESEISEREAAVGTAADLARLNSVQQLMSRLQPPGHEEAPPEEVEAYLNLLFVNYRFWKAGGTVVARTLAEIRARMGEEVGPPDVPGGACYLQLPERVFWAQVSDDAPHEPVDGTFVVRGGDPSVYTLVAVLGLHPDRRGFGEISLTARPGDFVAALGEQREHPFEPVVEGGREAGILSLVSHAELLYLVSLALPSAAE